jgi:RNA polymerase sigma factor (sigma-70 family)
VSATDDRLLSATSRGDGDAFAAFFRRHEPAVARFAIRRCDSADEVADAIADTFLVALRRAGSYDARQADARPWLLGIAQRVIGGQRRSRVRRARLIGRAATLPAYEPDEAERVDAAIDAARRLDDLRPRIDALPRRDREVLELVAFADLEPHEAALALGISANAARLRLARARRRLGEPMTEVSYAG